MEEATVGFMCIFLKYNKQICIHIWDLVRLSLCVLDGFLLMFVMSHICYCFGGSPRRESRSELKYLLNEISNPFNTKHVV